LAAIEKKANRDGGCGKLERDGWIQEYSRVKRAKVSFVKFGWKKEVGRKLVPRCYNVCYIACYHVVKFYLRKFFKTY